MTHAQYIEEIARILEESGALDDLVPDLLAQVEAQILADLDRLEERAA